MKQVQDAVILDDVLLANRRWEVLFESIKLGPREMPLSEVIHRNEIIAEEGRRILGLKCALCYSMRKKIFLIRLRKKDGRLDYRVAGTRTKVRGINRSLFTATELNTKYVSKERIIELQNELNQRGRARFVIDVMRFTAAAV